MGFRYYAYAFDGELAAEALANPRSFVSSDPLADAWGITPGARSAVATMRQSVSKQDMLYLDKAWSDLQTATCPLETDTAARPSYRMFEGQVTHADWGWEPWLRVLTPAEVIEIARDLDQISDDEVRARLRGRSRFGSEDGRDEAEYALQHLAAARAFLSGLVTSGRGMVYMIG